MINDTFRTGHLVGIFMLCCVLFGYPIMTLFNIDALVFGIPVLYVYVFATWCLIIFMIFIATRWRAKPDVPEKESSSSFLADDTAA